MWNLLNLANYWNSAAAAARSRQDKRSRNRGSRPRLARLHGFEQLENRSLLSAMPTWATIGVSANSVTFGQTVA